MTTTTKAKDFVGPARSSLDPTGAEVFVQPPLARALHISPQLSVREQMYQMILEMSRLQREGYETFESADDFDIEDDYGDDIDSLPNYEQDFDHLSDYAPPPPPRGGEPVSPPRDVDPDQPGRVGSNSPQPDVPDTRSR